MLSYFKLLRAQSQSRPQKYLQKFSFSQSSLYFFLTDFGHSRLDVINSKLQLKQMQQSALATSSSRFIKDKGPFSLQLFLSLEPTGSILSITGVRKSMKETFRVRIDQLDISRDKQLGSVFKEVEEVYKELSDSFDQIEVIQKEEALLISFEVAMGKFRKEKITLVAKRVEVQEEVTSTSRVLTPSVSLDKVPIDKTYEKDANIFKNELNTLCKKIAASSLAKEIEATQGWQKNKIKNMFISFSNALLKNLHQNTTRKRDDHSKHPYVFYLPENELLNQKNELLHKIYKKAVTKTKDLPVQDLGIEFDLSVPKKLIVVQEGGKETPLQDFLPPLYDDQMRKNIEYYEERENQLLKAEQQLDAIRAKRLEQVQKYLRGHPLRSKKVDLRGRVNDENLPQNQSQF